MRRVLFLIGNLESGGAENVLLTIVNRMCREYEISVQTVYNEGVLRQALDKRIHYTSIIQHPNLLRKRIIHRLITYLPPEWIYKWYIKQKYDVVIAFLEGISSKIVSGAGRSTKTFAWIHADIRNIDPKIAGFTGQKDQQKCYNQYCKVVCVSENAKQAFIASVKPLVDPVVITNPIDREAIISLSSNINKDEKKSGFTFCSVGRLVEVKAFERIICALAKLQNEGFHCVVWIVGDGEKSDELKLLAKALNIEESVKFFGFLQNPYQIMKRCDAFICSSKHEGYSMVVAEALVLGIPVITTNTIGPREILENGKYGMIVDNSEAGVYSGMKSVLSNAELLHELKEKAILRGSSFDIQKTMREIRTLIDSV